MGGGGAGQVRPGDLNSMKGNHSNPDPSRLMTVSGDKVTTIEVSISTPSTV